MLYRLSYLGLQNLAPIESSTQDYFCKRADPKVGPSERAMRFELTTFSLARRRSTTELRPQSMYLQSILIDKRQLYLFAFKCANLKFSIRQIKVDPVGFEPTIFSLQRRRLPARPRAQINHSSADERTRTSTPLRAIDPKSIASANSATSACHIHSLHRI